MTTSHGAGVPPNEAPYQVQTPTGPAVISVVALIVGNPGHDRLVLRSTGEGTPDVYAVFERRHGPTQTWQKITDDLSLAQLDSWTAYRRPPTTPTRPFQQWLDHVAGAPRGAAGRDTS